METSLPASDTPELPVLWEVSHTAGQTTCRGIGLLIVWAVWRPVTVMGCGTKSPSWPMKVSPAKMTASPILQNVVGCLNIRIWLISASTDGLHLPMISD